MADKYQALLRAGLLYPKADRVRSPLFRRLPFFDPRDKLQVKYEMLRSHEADRISITEAADLFAYTRQGFYQVHKAFQAEGMAGLIEKKRGRRGPVKCSPAVVNFVLQEKHAHPEWTGRQLAARLLENKGVRVHRRTIEKIISGLRIRGRKKNRRSIPETRQPDLLPGGAPSFWQMGGPVQKLYEGLRAEMLGEDTDRAIDPAVRERFAQAGFIALFPGEEGREAGWMPPFQMEMESAGKNPCSLRTFVEVFRLIIERSVENLPAISRRTNREHFSTASGHLRQGLFAPPAEAGHHRKPAGRVA